MTPRWFLRTTRSRVKWWLIKAAWTAQRVWQAWP